MAAKHCIRKYRLRLKASRISQRQVGWANAARKELFNASPVIRQNPRQTGKTAAFNARISWLLKGAQYLSAPSGVKVKSARLRINTMTLPINKEEPWLNQFQKLFQQDSPQFTVQSLPGTP